MWTINLTTTRLSANVAGIPRRSKDCSQLANTTFSLSGKEKQRLEAPETVGIRIFGINWNRSMLWPCGKNNLRIRGYTLEAIQH